MSLVRRHLGQAAEDAAARLLQAKGYTVLEKNYRQGRGEIDLICQDGTTLVFVEVKYRTSSSCGFPQEAVNWRKQRQLTRLARRYLCSRGLYNSVDCRFDVVAIAGPSHHLMVHLVDAFRPTPK